MTDIMTGSIIPIITPFKNYEIDYPKLEELIEYHIQNGSHGLLPCGSTGESATMSHKEHADLVKFVVEKVKGRIPVMAGTGSNSTQEAIELAIAAEAAGATCHLSITPYYNKPTQEGLYLHFKAIAEAVELPMVLYNVPGRTGVNLLPETVARLAKIPNIIGIKEATGNVRQALEILELCGRDFALYSGDDFINYPLLAIGAKGTISVTANIAPKEMSDMYEAFKAGDTKKALDIHYSLMALHRSMFIETNPVPVKVTAFLMGLLDTAELRLPLCQMTDANLAKLKVVLKDYKLI